MSTAIEVLDDAFDRIGQGVLEVVDGLSPDDLARRVTPDANPIGWLLWHLLRVQDDHVADVAGAEQVWDSAEWSQRFALPFEPGATGYGQSREEVSAVHVTADLLAGYARGVTEATRDYLRGVSETDLDRVVDERWDPPVTLGARLVSVIEDDLKHLGQAEYAKGLL